MSQNISKIGVIGAGQMGHGIAQVAAVAGYDVVLADIDADALDKAQANIERSLNKLVDKERLTAEARDAALGRLQRTTSTAEACQVDLLIEAATENEELKYKLFAMFDEHAPEHTLLATNTSSISITRIAAATNRPEKVVGMHFMNPVPLMKLCELIRGLQTSDEAFAAVEAAAQKMGKETVVAEDYPGFIVNRILMPMINEAVYTLMEGVADVDDIDAAMTLGTNQPMGPLKLADFIGLDTCLAIMEVLHEGLGDAKYRPCPLLRKYVDAGWLGKKTGRGFHDWSKR